MVAGAGGFRPASVGTTKNLVTPPLDLSEGRRHVESPLDLSVKTRKRCADTTDFEDIMGRAGLLSDAIVAKRSCLSKRDFTYPPGHHGQVVSQEKISEKHLADMKMIHHQKQQQQQHQIHQQQQHQQQQQQHHALMRSKMGPAQQKFPTVAGIQMSPTAMVQQLELERQIAQQSRQMPMSAPAQPMRPHPSPSQFSPHLASPQQSPLQRRQSSPYDMPHPPAPQMPPTASQTESVALKGFFEPTQRVTVNAAPNQSMVPTSRQSHPHASMQQQMMSPERALSHNAARGMAGLPADHAVHEEHRQPPSGYPPSSMYQRGSTGRMVPAIPAKSPSGPGHLTELEMMQQRQLQYQMQHHQSNPSKHFPREQSVTQTQKSPLPPHAAQDQRLAMMMEIQKQESRKMQFPETATIVRQVAYPEGSIRHEKGELNVRCMKVGQPVPLPEIHQSHTQTLERVQGHPDMYRSRHQPETRPYVDAVAVSSATDTNVRSLPSTTGMRYQVSRYRHPDHFEKQHSMPGLPVTEAMPVHPSVIQRPQGYIPPRIVRRESADTVPVRRPSERDRMQPNIPGVHPDFHPDHISIRQEMSMRGHRSHHGTSKDMLSGRDVLRIQQRAAEQRHSEMHISTKHHSKPIDIVVGDVHVFSERRRSLTDINSSRPHPNESIRRPPSADRGRLMSPPSQPVPSSSKEPANIMQSPRATTSYNNSKTESANSSSHAGRSITKGTSGISKTQQKDDFLSQFLMRELKKTNDDDSINPFANRSLLQEFDRSSNNSSPVRATTKPTQPEVEAKKEPVTVVENPKKTESVASESTESSDTNKPDSSYTLPLQIAIPGHKTNAQAPVSSERTSVIANPKVEPSTVEPPKPQKFMSRKQMILSAFRQDEDLNKKTVDIDKDEKVPVESSKFALMKLEKESSHYTPPSPKMPILSPQERSRNTPLVSPAPTEQQPPNLENLSNSSSGSANGEKGKEKMSSLEEHLHRMISHALNKDSKESNNEKFVVEAMCREIQTQGHKLFVSRQSSITRNIPVANVAPIIHGKVMPESTDPQLDDTTKEESETQKTECVDTDLDDEDAKIAEVVTRSIFGDRLGRPEEMSDQQEQSQNKTDDQIQTSAIDNTQELDNESAFDENSNSMRMSPGLKKLMLYRHRDTGDCSSGNGESVTHQDNVSEVSVESVSKSSDSGHKRKHVETNRNVFGALNEIVAQQCSDRTSPPVEQDHEMTDSTKAKRHQKNIGWTGYQNEDDDDETADVVSRYNK